MFPTKVPLVEEINNSRRISEPDDVLYLLTGFIEGIVNINGAESLIVKCNTNITLTEKIWWTNWEKLFDNDNDDIVCNKELPEYDSDLCLYINNNFETDMLI